MLSIFTGSEIVGSEDSTSRDAVAALGTGGTVMVKFKKADTYRLVIKRVQPFKSFEVSLIRSILEEMGAIYNSPLGINYLKDLEVSVIQNAICKALSFSASKTINEILNQMETWSQRTYEGNKTTFGFIVANKKAPASTNSNLHISQFIKRDFSALISDGTNTCLEISANGFLLNYLTVPKAFDQELLVPYEQIRIASLCTGNKVGICLLQNGDILLFRNKTLLFAKRNGAWVCFSHEEIISKLADRSGDYTQEVRKAIYLSALDTSFARTGGCIVHLNKEDYFNVLKHIDICDVLNATCYENKVQENKNTSFFIDTSEEEESVSFEQFLTEPKMIKSANLIKIIANRKFYELDRKLRLELMGIDGATVIDADGNILAVGAIIKIEAGSTGGGRLAAAKTLSKYGMSIKISNDGRMEGFRMDKQKLRVRPLFILG